MLDVWKAFENLSKPVDTGNPIADGLETISNGIGGLVEGQIIDNLLNHDTEAPILGTGGFFQNGNWNY